MGYYTYHTLEIRDNDTGKMDSEIIAELREENSEAEWALDDNGDCADGVKWYSRREDLQRFSTRYPSLVFMLDCTGEEGARWRDYFHNGHVETIHAEFPEFNINNFKNAH